MVIYDYNAFDLHSGDLHSGDLHSGDLYSGDLYFGDLYSGDLHSECHECIIILLNWCRKYSLVEQPSYKSTVVTDSTLRCSKILFLEPL
ncbi:hypothetical protein WUBG_02655 [Wuchereria bancrofti]|uniref:Uncharacterized protein n=1 Tax=Wuchereria bancrofti TaxID=6293 RepID=J9BGJ3_WUCBA|nr:hypothetical protein WUBG_02655 [Wuchereria bancrofti]